MRKADAERWENWQEVFNVPVETAAKLMHFCEEVWVFGDVISDGMKQEIKYAKGEGDL